MKKEDLFDDDFLKQFKTAKQFSSWPRLATEQQGIRGKATH
ncbi:hypothetical protein SAMN04487911_13016 [Arenibacter nanhaiticus]|uniref:Uncharacterized protein n=1 Tax=Arenibacter nanhaiticus TaxID=558155 RepID=A0A1M6L879_9FLAO|nr:hypothetical protein [Arenibacter nanhaiticus]SHJ67364.1 hypothetical protein SAMN04487911_13016 [Arenibacter nanhaiticus]